MSAYDTVRTRLDAGGTVLIDGATGTELERRGADMHPEVWCAMATETAPEVLRQVHEDYIRAGARVIFTNTFSSSLNMLEPAGLVDRFERLNRASVQIARAARENLGVSGEVAIAASVSHQLPMHVGRGESRSRADLPPARRIRDNARAMMAIQIDAGVDLIGLEMMYDPRLAVPTLEAALDTGLPVWLGTSCRMGEDGAPGAYYDPRVPYSALLEALLPAPVQAVGVMHSNVNVTGRALTELREHFPGPLMAYPDSGHFRMPHWQFEDVIAPAALAEHALAWHRTGARILGGCCGLGLAHLEALAGVLATPEGVLPGDG